jgi:hypothetical protein
MTRIAGHMGDKAKTAVVAELLRTVQACAHTQLINPFKFKILQTIWAPDAQLIGRLACALTALLSQAGEGSLHRCENGNKPP